MRPVGFETALILKLRESGGSRLRLAAEIVAI
jgi:hypothetical protein